MSEIIALYGGSFKPVTKGHFEVVKKSLKEFPEVDKFKILVGKGIRGGITQTESIKIWEIYKKYLSPKIEIIASSSPIGDIIRTIRDNPEDLFYFVLGARIGKPQDFKDINSRTKNLDQKYKNFLVKIITTTSPEMSGTNPRLSLAKDKKEFYEFLPNEVSILDKNKIYNILNSSQLNEDLKFSEDYKDKIKELALYYKKKYNLSSLPKIIIKNNDVENAQNILGNTGYYNPSNKSIVIYTKGRHPKDIMKTFSHEINHYIQDLEGRLNNITTTNTLKDKNLDKLEREAYLKGDINFRHWTDSLKENKKDIFGLTNYAKSLSKEIITEGLYDSIVTQIASDTFNKWKTDFNNHKSFSRFSKSYELKDKKGRPLDFDYIAYIQFKETPEGDYIVDGGSDNGEEGGYENGFITLKFQVDPRELPKQWSTISIDIRDVIRHEIEHLTQGGFNLRNDKFITTNFKLRNQIQTGKKPKKDYFLLPDEIDPMLQGLYMRAKKSHTPFLKTIEDYLNKVGLSSEDQKEILKVWKSRAFHLSLPLFESSDPKKKYKIYVDLDGVLVDFNKRFEQFSNGISPKEYQDKYGKDKFWEFIDNKIGIRFWIGMKWMPGGKKLWNYVKKYNPILLSSPAISNHASLGKRLWKKNNLPDAKLVLAQAKDKQKYADKDSILIDDYNKTIDEWNESGGIGILYKNTPEVIKKLKKLGL